jgi:Localisation of periplasmic protein complexes.
MTHAVSAAQNTINDVRVSPDAAKTRIVFDVDTAPDFTYFTLKKPLRLVIDLKNTASTFKLSSVKNSAA